MHLVLLAKSLLSGSNSYLNEIDFISCCLSSRVLQQVFEMHIDRRKDRLDEVSTGVLLLSVVIFLAYM